MSRYVTPGSFGIWWADDDDAYIPHETRREMSYRNFLFVACSLGTNGVFGMLLNNGLLSSFSLGDKAGAVYAKLANCHLKVVS